MPDELKVDYVFFRERLESNISMKSSLSIRFKAAAIQCGNRTHKSLVHSALQWSFELFLCLSGAPLTLSVYVLKFIYSKRPKNVEQSLL